MRRDLGTCLRLVSVVVVVLGTMVIQPGAAQENKATAVRLSVVGIGVRNYPESQRFYETIMGLPVAFRIPSQDGTRTTTYYQLSRNTFLEMQLAADGVAPGFTHIHLGVDDIGAAVARFRRAGLGT